MKALPFFLFIVLAPLALQAQMPYPQIASLDSDRAERVLFLNPEYLIHLPENTDSEGKLPLVIYLHGAGGVGEDARRNSGRVSAVVEGIQQFETGPCLVVAPQCRLESEKSEERGTWEAQDLDLLLEHLLESYDYVDSDRVYLIGTSMGGYGCWMWGGHSPQHFAAIVPIVGGIGRGGPKDITPDLEAWAANLAKVPLWAFHGANDRVVPADRSEQMIQAIREAGGTQAKITVYPDEGHGAGRRVFSSPELFDWMFAQKRDRVEVAP